MQYYQKSDNVKKRKIGQYSDIKTRKSKTTKILNSEKKIKKKVMAKAQTHKTNVYN